MQSLHYYLTHIRPTIGSIVKRVPYLFHNDEKYLKLLYYLKTGNKLDLHDPKRFNEKLQWLKLYNHVPSYTNLVDKYFVKNIVSEIIGKRYVIPTIGVWDSIEAIDWTVLPKQFVLKTTHGGGSVGVVVCKDKDSLNKSKAQRKLSVSMRVSGYEGLKEWPYKDVKRRIIAEQYIEDSENKQLIDFKFHCFNGIPKVVLVCKDRYMEHGATKDFFDMEWNHLEISRELNANAKSLMPEPAEFKEMIRIAEVLSKNIPFVRIDLYLANHNIYFGEYTFFPASGFSNFYPDKWDFIFGEWLELPKL